ncbi:hypothetical protein LXL04_003874 [Taraxacum kok-saghyz]
MNLANIIIFFVQMMWKLNFFEGFCCIALNNDYMLYYICPMHTLFSLMVYGALAIGMWEVPGVFDLIWGPFAFLLVIQQNQIFLDCSSGISDLGLTEFGSNLQSLDQICKNICNHELYSLLHLETFKWAFETLERYRMKFCMFNDDIQTFLKITTFNNELYPTFRKAAVERGLVETDDNLSQCLTEASLFQFPVALRSLFATILIYCELGDVRKLWDEYYHSLSEDYSRQCQSYERVKTMVLVDIGVFLQSMGKNRSTKKNKTSKKK